MNIEFDLEELKEILIEHINDKVLDFQIEEHQIIGIQAELVDGQVYTLSVFIDEDAQSTSD